MNQNDTIGTRVLWALGGALVGALLGGIAVGLMHLELPNEPHESYLLFGLFLLLYGWYGALVGAILGGIGGFKYGMRFRGVIRWICCAVIVVVIVVVIGVLGVLTVGFLSMWAS
jgi:hypothetical protein